MLSLVLADADHYLIVYICLPVGRIDNYRASFVCTIFKLGPNYYLDTVYAVMAYITVAKNARENQTKGHLT